MYKEFLLYNNSSNIFAEAEVFFDVRKFKLVIFIIIIRVKLKLGKVAILATGKRTGQIFETDNWHKPHSLHSITE